jgi:hypothetical protein
MSERLITWIEIMNELGERTHNKENSKDAKS